MKKTTASLLIAGLTVTAGVANAQTYVDLSREIFKDDFQSYEAGDRPPNVTLGAQNTYPPAIVVDTDDLFGLGTANKFLQYRKVRHSSFPVNFSSEPSSVVRVSFDFISRNMPADENYDADGRWLNFTFYARDEDRVLNNNARAHATQLIVRNGTFRANATNHPAVNGLSYGAVDELVHFDMFFNNSNETILYDAPGGGVEALAPLKSAVWVNGVRLVDDYNETRTGINTEGSLIHGFAIGIDSNADGILSFDIDNLELYGVIPEPSTYALLFGALALGGAVYFRRRRE